MVPRLWGSEYIDKNLLLAPYRVTQPKWEEIQSAKKRFLVGRNDESINIAKILSVDGIIDDYNDEQFAGFTAIRSGDIPNDSQVIVAASSISPVSVRNKLQSQLGPWQILDYRCLYLATEGRLPMPSYGISSISFLENRSKYQELHARLSDERSRKVLRGLLSFRLSGEPSFVARTKSPTSRHYLLSQLMGDYNSIVDFGANDGTIATRLYNFYQLPKTVVLYEPNASHNFAIKEKFQKLQADFQIRNVAVRDSAARGGMLNLGASDSVFSENVNGGVDAVDVRTEALPTNNSLWKFDIEGDEVAVVSAISQRLIGKKVNLAISAYHRPTDLMDLADKLLEVFPKADFFLRHYTEGWSETVLFVKNF